jgi:3-isopropylmalate/(R)-2-methylmalate dehydratase small subunit
VQPFVVHRGTAAPLLRRDVDTDQIIPKQFLKSIERTGFGRYLFHDWRTNADGSPNPQFVLNDARFREVSILIAGANFGCGSSREHAAWALADYGFRAIIAPSFADIFRNNALTNGLLPVAVREEIALTLADHAAEREHYTIEIDLTARRIRDGISVDEPFAIDDTARHRLLHGLDDIGLILQHEPAIARFESTRSR